MRTPLALAVVLSACGLAGPGAECSSEGDCREELLCTGTNRDVRLCMQPCTGGTRFCEDGTACLDVAGTFVCYVGGNNAYGDPCARDLDCEPGTVCPSEYSTCLQACMPGDDRPCAATEHCEESSAGGICRPLPSRDAGVDAGIDAGSVGAP